MIPGLKILSPGLMSSIQDLGRRAFQDVGVPVSGALDRESFLLANALVGNPAESAAIEVLLLGPTLEVVAESVRVALVGGRGGLQIEEPRGLVPAGQSVRLTRGARFGVTPLAEVSCAYLAVEGGVAVGGVLGSRSTYGRNRLGGLDGRALQSADVVPLFQDRAEERDEVELAAALDMAVSAPIRVVLGPQDDYFTTESIELLLSGTFSVSQQADRMGYRLDGPRLQHRATYDIVSDGIVPGSIQVPGSGQPIVLLADAQTTGGYPKIATVASADVPRLARRRTGAAVRFEALSQSDAEALRRERDATLAKMIRGIRPVLTLPRIDLAALYAENLVDGVASARD